MGNTVKIIASYVLIAIVLALTVISLLAIWEIIEAEDILRKILFSLFVVFVASVVVLFIFAVIIRDGNVNNKPNQQPKQ
ncbi:MAG: hypothetical protein ABIJ97_06270 [Bacteroidota bacterium]